MNSNNIVEKIDFDDVETKSGKDYQTSQEAVEDYGNPVVDAGELEVTEETVPTGRTSGLQVDLDNESFQELYSELKSDLEEEYMEADLDASTARTDFGATVGVALAAEAAELEYNTERILDKANEQLEFEMDRPLEGINAGQDAYMNALDANKQRPPLSQDGEGITSEEPEGTGNILESE